MSGAKPKVSIEDLYLLMSDTNENLGKKIESVEKKLENLTSVFHEDICHINNKVEVLQAENRDLKRRVEILEKKVKSNNLIFYGVVEDKKETQAKLCDKLLQIITETIAVNLSRTEIVNIHRLGRNKEKTRLTLITLHSQIKKKEILTNCNKLKGTKLFVSEDLTENELEERKLLVEYYKKAREEGKIAKIKNKYLVVDEVKYSVEQLKHLEEEQNLETAAGQSPPEVSLVGEPPTTVTLNTEGQLQKDQAERFRNKEKGGQEVTSRITHNHQAEKTGKYVEEGNTSAECIPKKPIGLRSFSKNRRKDK